MRRANRYLGFPDRAGRLFRRAAADADAATDRNAAFGVQGFGFGSLVLWQLRFEGFSAWRFRASSFLRYTYSHRGHLAYLRTTDREVLSLDP